MDSLKLVSVGSIREHLARVELFLQLGIDKANDPSRAFRIHVAAVYFAQAAAELFIAETQFQHGAAKADLLKQELARNVAHYNLVGNVRVADFHKHALRPPIKGRTFICEVGPVKLTSRQMGTAAIIGVGPEQRVIAERNSSVKFDRPVQQRDNLLFDDKGNEWVPINTVVEAFSKTI